MHYQLDLSKISLEDYNGILEREPLIPSFRILRTQAGEILLSLKTMNLTDLGAVYNRVKKRAALEPFSKESGIPADLLIILRRHLSSYKPKIRLLKEFPRSCFTDAVNAFLQAEGIKNAGALWTAFYHESQATHSGPISDSGEWRRLLAMCDFCRLRYVSPLFAELMVRAKIPSALSLVQMNSEDLLASIQRANSDSLYKGKIGLRDMEFLIYNSRLLERYC